VLRFKRSLQIWVLVPLPIDAADRMGSGPLCCEADEFLGRGASSEIQRWYSHATDDAAAAYFDASDSKYMF
jgi:hypothetical protein